MTPIKMSGFINQGSGLCSTTTQYWVCTVVSGVWVVFGNDPTSGFLGLLGFRALGV